MIIVGNIINHEIIRVGTGSQQIYFKGIQAVLTVISARILGFTSYANRIKNSVISVFSG
jgi:hypothetical protein